jgi:hypothetical protein
MFECDPVNVNSQSKKFTQRPFWVNFLLCEFTETQNLGKNPELASVKHVYKVGKFAIHMLFHEKFLRIHRLTFGLRRT